MSQSFMLYVKLFKVATRRHAFRIAYMQSDTCVRVIASLFDWRKLFHRVNINDWANVKWNDSLPPALFA